MGAEPYIGDIMMFGGNFAPSGWAFCNGQLLPISQNQALFSLLGTMYGGDGMTTFGLPDLRGRLPVGVGQGPGLSNYTEGEPGGTESVTLTTSSLPAHNHPRSAYNDKGDQSSPANGTTAAIVDSSNGLAQGFAASANTAMSPVGATGGGQPHENRQPFLCINFCIATEGIYPSRG